VSAEPTKEEFHAVDNAEADAAIEAIKHAIPINELIGRVLRNIYPRLQAAEQKAADLETEVKKLKTKRNLP
jgi:hypothetical protein